MVHPAFGIDSNAQYGIKGVPKDPRFYGGLPHMPIARFARLGGPFFRPQFQNSQVLQVLDNLSWQKGAHALKFGVDHGVAAKLDDDDLVVELLQPRKRLNESCGLDAG